MNQHGPESMANYILFALKTLQLFEMGQNME